MGNQGLNGGQALDDNGNYNFTHSIYNQVPLMVSAGAARVRLNFRLGAYYSDWVTAGANGFTALQQYDNVVNAITAAGLKILGLISNESWPGGQSAWVVNNVENGGTTGDNTYVQDFSTNAAVVLATHFTGITTWEIWNEPDAWTSNPSPTVFTGGSFLYPSNFAWLLHHVYNDTRTAGLSGLTFVSGGLFGNDLGPTVATQSVKYITNTYTMGIAHANWSTDLSGLGSYPLDMIGYHIYVDQGGSTPAYRIKSWVLIVRNAVQVFEGQNSRKLLLITEMGWSSVSIGQSLQATNLATAYDELRLMPSIQPQVYWFAVQDTGGAFWGLYDGTGAMKQSSTSYLTHANF